MATTDGTTAPTRAVVLISGVLSTTPFTTPDAACATGFAAGNTFTFLRSFLLEAGFRVFTAPQRVGDGQVEETADTFIGPFGSCPERLPTWMTVNTTAGIDHGAMRLRAFVDLLHFSYGITEIDLVGHSMGGLLARELIAGLVRAGHRVAVRSLTTIGSPWTRAMISAATNPDVPQPTDGLATDESFVAVLRDAEPEIFELRKQIGIGYPEWAASLGTTLTGIPVTLIGGSFFDKVGGTSDQWPNDGVVQLAASTAVTVSSEVLPDRRVHVLPLTHSLFVSASSGLEPNTSLTWNPDVGGIIVEFLRSIR